MEPQLIHASADEGTTAARRRSPTAAPLDGILRDPAVHVVARRAAAAAEQTRTTPAKISARDTASTKFVSVIPGEPDCRFLVADDDPLWHPAASSLCRAPASD